MEKISRCTDWPTAKPNLAMGNAHGKRERYRPWLEAKITVVFEPQSVDHSLSLRGSCHPLGFQLSRRTRWPTAKSNLAMGNAHGKRERYRPWLKAKITIVFEPYRSIIHYRPVAHVIP